jgi:hypothetical protein
VAAELQAVESMPTISASQFEASGLEGAFYSAQHAPGTENEWPPLPGNWLSLPIWVIDTNLFLIDDLNYDYNAASQAASKASSQRGGGIHAMDESGGGGFSPDFSFATNSLWLQMINVTNDTAYLTLNNATDSVYEIWSKTDLTLTNWTIEQELWPTDTTSMPFTISEQGRTNLFVWARDWTGITSNGNTTPDWWFWLYFGTTDLSDSDLDSVGDTLLYDYENGLDPNPIQFSLQFTNTVLNTSTAYGTVAILGGVPSYEAILINDTNEADAVWQPYTSTNVTVNLDSGDGIYNVMVGLRGLPTNAVQTWLGAQLTLNTVAPMLTVTNPATGTVSVPMIQLQGYVNESLGKLTFDVSNATGIFTNQTGYWQPAFYDTNQLTFTTNSFQCYDIPLTNGVNVITLHATDLEGNMTTTNFSCTLSYAGVTNPPALTLLWPTNDTAIGGTNFTLQAQVDDATATISAAINGNTVQGIVERSGAVWVKNLPLNSGTNTVTLTATNAAGNVSTTNFDVVQSAVSVTVDPLPAAELNQSSVTVTGMVGNPGDNVTVNGVGAYYTDDAGDWEADGVPVSPSGTASVDVEVTDSDDNPVASQMSDQLQPVTVVLSSYCAVDSVDSYDSYYQSPDDQNRTLNWLYGLGGTDHEFGIVPTGEGSPRSNPYDDSEGIPADLSGYYGGPESENAALGTTTLSGDGYDDVISIERSIQSKLMIMPQGQATAGTTQLYLVEVTAAELTDPIYLYFTNMLSPEGLQVNGQPVVNSGITNEDGSMPGLALVSGAAGAPVPLTVTETRALQYQDFTNGIQVYQLVSQCVATTPSDQSRTNLGVGEQVNFYFNPAPTTTNITWSATAGSLAVTSGMTNLFTAPDNATNVTVTVTIGSAPVNLYYKITEPSSETSVIGSTNTFPAGIEGAGMQLIITWGPTNVSFAKVQILEVPGPASSITGYFTNFPSASLSHFPNTNWVTLSSFNQTADTASVSNLPAPWYPGGFDWNIPVQWKIVNGNKTNNFPTNEIQSFRITDTNGTTTVSKLGSSVTRTP